ncbi:hypothetical protein [Blastococcus sp. SYSU DS0539]
MDAATAAAWLVLGVVLGVLAVGAVVAGVAAARRRGAGTRERAPAARDEPVDDLADFLAHPPGTRPEPPAPAGWATLAPAPPSAPAPPVVEHRLGHLPAAALCVAALVLVGTAAAVVAGTDRPPAAAPATTPPRTSGLPPGDDGGTGAVAVDLAFGGLVLEPRAVGITAAYPEVAGTAGDDAARMALRLPTWNCLTAEPPPDPVAAGCVATPVEHGTLGPADLRIARDGDRLTLRGRVATATHPAGSAPRPTGRVYDVELTVAPGGEAGPDGVRPAAAWLRLGAGTATADEGRSVLRPAG